MSHPLVLALFKSPAAASLGARALHDAGISRDQISVISRNHDEDTAFAKELDATPGTDIEDSRVAARLGELSGYVLAAMAFVLPGVGSIVAAGPLAAGLGEAAGHVAGGVAGALNGAGVASDRAAALEHAVRHGGVLLAVHTTPAQVQVVRAALDATADADVEVANWSE
jgi:hypothetical protein